VPALLDLGYIKDFKPPVAKPVIKENIVVKKDSIN